MPRRKIIITIAIFASLLGVANIVASAAIATTGNKLQELQSDAQKLEDQTQALERAVANQQSFAHIETRAQELGLTGQAATVTLANPEQIAALLR